MVQGVGGPAAVPPQGPELSSQKGLTSEQEKKLKEAEASLKRFKEELAWLTPALKDLHRLELLFNKASNLQQNGKPIPARLKQSLEKTASALASIPNAPPAIKDVANAVNQAVSQNNYSESTLGTIEQHTNVLAEASVQAQDPDCYLICSGRMRGSGWWFVRCDETNSLCTIREEKRTNPEPLRRGMADKGGGNLGPRSRTELRGRDRQDQR